MAAHALGAAAATMFSQGGTRSVLNTSLPSPASVSPQHPRWMVLLAKPWSKLAADTLLWGLAVPPIAYWLRLDQQFAWNQPGMWLYMAALAPLKAAALAGFGIQRTSWRKVGVRDLKQLLAAIATVTLAGSGVTLALQQLGYAPVPRSVPLIEALFALFVLGGVRMAVRIGDEQVRRERAAAKARRTLVVGAGEAGTMLAREILRHPEAGVAPLGFVDDDPTKRKQRFFGLPVLGRIDQLPEICARQRIDEVLIAMPSAPGEVIRRVVAAAQAAGVAYRIVPALHDLISGRIAISDVREVDVDDLLRRRPVRLDDAGLAALFQDAVILITGGGGSIGSELARQVARFQPRKVLLYGHGEASLFAAQRELAERVPCEMVVGDVRDLDKLHWTLATHAPSVIFHTAAHKHVPLMETFPDEAVLNNVLGTHNVVQAALAAGTARVVNVSTDKAVNPTSVLGATKRVAERIVAAAAAKAKPGQVFVSVRFGNVLGSRGSVVPIFKQQLRTQRVLTVTHPDMTRYFMTLPEASQLLLQAASIGENGCIYILDMGAPVKIVDLAEDLIRLSGLIPYKDVDIHFTGIRPGEKLHEELLDDSEDTEPSPHEQITVLRSTAIPDAAFAAEVEALIAAAQARDAAAVRASLKRLVPEYRAAV